MRSTLESARLPPRVQRILERVLALLSDDLARRLSDLYRLDASVSDAYNAGGYYDSLLTFLDSSVQAGFMGQWQMELLRVSDSASELLPALLKAARPDAPDRLEQI